MDRDCSRPAYVPMWRGKYTRNVDVTWLACSVVIIPWKMRWVQKRIFGNPFCILKSCIMLVELYSSSNLLEFWFYFRGSGGGTQIGEGPPGSPGGTNSCEYRKRYTCTLKMMKSAPGESLCPNLNPFPTPPYIYIYYEKFKCFRCYLEFHARGRSSDN